MIPAGIIDLRSFRAWAHSDEFPQRGSISYVRGEIIVDMSPEEMDLGRARSQLPADAPPHPDRPLALSVALPLNPELVRHDQRAETNQRC
ncbi:MAG: hypothetical protein WD069_13700 [Planctomycetales bacterium]